MNIDESSADIFKQPFQLGIGNYERMQEQLQLVEVHTDARYCCRKKERKKER